MLVRWYFKTGFKYERRVNGQGQAIGRLCPVKSLNDRTLCPVFYTSKGPVIIHRRGGGERRIWGSTRWNLAVPHLNVTSLIRVIPPNNFLFLMTFAIPPPPLPHVFIFHANLSGPPSEFFQSFQQSTVLGSQLRLMPPFVLPKIKWSP